MYFFSVLLDVNVLIVIFVICTEPILAFFFFLNCHSFYFNNFRTFVAK